MPGYIGNTQGFHYGWDWSPVPIGSSYFTRAAAPGTVVHAGPDLPVSVPNVQDGAWGTYLEIDHGTIPGLGHVRTGYAHHRNIEASVGDHVERGDVIGIVGVTGLTDGGVHVHFQLLIENPESGQWDRVDPGPLLHTDPRFTYLITP